MYDAFQNLVKIAKGENVVTPSKEYNPQEVEEALQNRTQKLTEAIRERYPSLEACPQLTKYQEAIDTETAFTSDQKNNVKFLANFIFFANDTGMNLSTSSRTASNKDLTDLQKVPGINQDTKDMLIGLASDLAKIPNQPDTGANIFAAKQAINSKTEK